MLADAADPWQKWVCECPKSVPMVSEMMGAIRWRSRTIDVEFLPNETRARLPDPPLNPYSDLDFGSQLAPRYVALYPTRPRVHPVRVGEPMLATVAAIEELNPADIGHYRQCVHEFREVRFPNGLSFFVGGPCEHNRLYVVKNGWTRSLVDDLATALDILEPK
jgi:hypothetical protein